MLFVYISAVDLAYEADVFLVEHNDDPVFVQVYVLHVVRAEEDLA